MDIVSVWGDENVLQMDGGHVDSKRANPVNFKLYISSEK